MKWAALITWVLTAGGGFVLLSIWLARGGMKSQAAGNRIKPPLIMSHFLLAATGLVLWIIYVVNDSSALAWIAFVLLLVVALLGFMMFAVWLRRRQADVSAATTDTPAEQHFPIAIVGLHGLLAATTLVLVLLAAAGVGGS
jgi:archaellum biogenesis protein FlaJ (TadC family)